jgi:hypothetical protein
MPTALPTSWRFSKTRVSTRSSPIEEARALFSLDMRSSFARFRPGWGCPRVIDLLDYSIIAANPKPISALARMLGALRVRLAHLLVNESFNSGLFRPDAAADCDHRQNQHGDLSRADGEALSGFNLRVCFDIAQCAHRGCLLAL